MSASYWPGIFHCYTVPDLPRTYNELEHFFGAARYHDTISSRSTCPAGKGLAFGKPRDAHVVAVGNVTCLTLSPAPPTEFSGRGGQVRADFALVHEPARRRSSLRRRLAAT